MPATVYPTGTVYFDPAKTWSGYTLFGSSLHTPNGRGAVLIDMNGNIVNRWRGLDGMPNKMLPGGRVLGSSGVRPHKYGYQDMLDVIQVDWDGNVEWKFDHFDSVSDPRHKPRWMARQHHDYQREGNPVGYYVPGADPLVDRGYTYILCHKTLVEPKISAHTLCDDAIIQVDWQGNILWEWTCSEHFEEFGFDEAAKNAIARNPNSVQGFMGPDWGDWMHMNSCSLVGPNKWWDAGDARFNPDNLIVDGRQTNIIFIISRETGKVVWKMGPDYTVPELKEIGQIIGQHHAHVIPVGLPGAGNIMLFDNGGNAGYGNPNPGAPTGVNNAKRDTSRVIEFDPKEMKIVWSYPKRGPGPGGGGLYSSFVSSAQRLPNGNTMITEGGSGRIMEVTPDCEVVWEYLSPYPAGRMHFNLIYRAYRVPYEWVPQVEPPKDVAIARPDNNRYRVPGSVVRKPLKVTSVKF
jgi:hypothetical protein